MRPYNGPGPGPERGPPPPQSRRSPPRDHHPAMGGPYPGQGQGGGQGLPPQSQPQGQGPPPPTQLQRVSNPNYAGPTGPAVLPPAQNGMNGPGQQGPLPPFGRGSSPRTEVRPILDNRMPSPKSAYPHQQQYPHHPDISNPGGIETGAPPPASALAAAENAANGRMDERPGSVGAKRHREWEDDTSMKKPASEENRARMEDMHHRRPSTPPGETFGRSSSEARRAEDQRREDMRRIDDQRRVEEQRRIDDQRRIEDQRRVDDQRRANENYHPSEAAHHPPMGIQPIQMPPMQGPPSVHTPLHTPIHELPPPPPPAPKEYPTDDREREQRVEHPPHPQTPIGEPERAARKMDDVDEDYDDDGEDEKKGGIVSAAASAAGDAKAGSPTGVNGHANGVGLANGQPKVETPA
jgi:glucose repression mediator protein